MDNIFSAFHVGHKQRVDSAQNLALARNLRGRCDSENGSDGTVLANSLGSGAGFGKNNNKSSVNVPACLYCLVSRGGKNSMVGLRMIVKNKSDAY